MLVVLGAELSADVARQLAAAMPDIAGRADACQIQDLIDCLGATE